MPVKALRTTARISGKGQLVSPIVVRQLERRYKVLELRRQGCTLEDIGNTLGCTPETVRDDLKVVLSRTAAGMMETTEEWREMEIDRMRSLLRRYQPLAEAGNLAAAALVLQISAVLRKMLALDMPEQKKHDESGVRIYIGINVDDV